jgi:leucyl-tRNA synthetase
VLLRVLVPGLPAHQPPACGLICGYAAAHGRSAGRALARGGRSRALQRDEIELMLQVNGKLRGSMPRQRPGRQDRPSRRAALASEASS